MMNKVIKLLQQGEVIALFQGRSEAGARALGNRSLIFNPTIEGMNDYVNEIKGREKYRPVAATVLSQQVYDWFDTDRLANSPYMSFAFGVRDNKRKLIPAVVHVDGTCRVQTVTEEQKYAEATFKQKSKDTDPVDYIEKDVEVLVCSLCEGNKFFLVNDDKRTVGCSQCGYLTSTHWIIPDGF